MPPPCWPLSCSSCPGPDRIEPREATPESDADLLYELAPGARLGWDIERLAEEPSTLLGRPVDLVSRRAIHDQLRAAVLAEARPIYAA